jgi:hypothetical protein
MLRCTATGRLEVRMAETHAAASRRGEVSVLACFLQKRLSVGAMLLRRAAKQKHRD